QRDESEPRPRCGERPPELSPFGVQRRRHRRIHAQAAQAESELENAAFASYSIPNAVHGHTTSHEHDSKYDPSIFQDMLDLPGLMLPSLDSPAADGPRQRTARDAIAHRRLRFGSWWLERQVRPQRCGAAGGNEPAEPGGPLG